ncbi:hypothetical protein ACFLQ8_04010, partial [Candidatus Auribacterota bacterium]
MSSKIKFVSIFGLIFLLLAAATVSAQDEMSGVDFLADEQRDEPLSSAEKEERFLDPEYFDKVFDNIAGK